jgi:hypothetical protein
MTDSLKIQAIERITNTIDQNVDKILHSSDGIFSESTITVIGMLLVAIITVLSQYLIMRKTFRTDFEKIREQISADFVSKSRLSWISDFRNIVSELITTTDPDYNVTLDKFKMCKLISQAQIMLDNSDKEERELGALITRLGLHTDYWNDKSHESQVAILKIQDAVLESTRTLLSKKQNDKNFGRKTTA